MSILTEQSTEPDYVTTRADQIKQHIRHSWRSIERNHRSGMRLLWDDHPEGVTPQDILDALGTSAGEAFILSGKLAALIGDVDPSAVINIPEGVTYTINDDGTVTLGSE